MQKKWIYLIILSVVWGSSFILIKKALEGLTPLQLGSLRTIFAAVFLLIIGYSKLKLIKKHEWKWIAISAFVGTFIPAFLFAFAETEIDSAVASVLNSTTPLMTLILGVILFSIGFTRNQLFGVIVGLIGSLLLIWKGADVNPNQNYWYAGLVMIASVCYAINVNIIKRYLQTTPSMAITVGHFVIILIPAMVVLFFSDFFKESTLNSNELLPAIGFLIILSVVGTGIAKILFNSLVQMSTPVFATSVTYTIPIVAVMWGFIDGERLSLIQILAGGLIIAGVFLSNLKSTSTSHKA